MNFLIKLLISAAIIIILAKFLPGVTLTSPYTNALWVALVLVLLNNIIKPILIILTLPITILSLGIFLLFINAAMILLADSILDGFAVNSVWTAILFSILLSIAQSVLHKAVKEDKK